MNNTTVKQYNKAFTLIELVAVIAIISIITVLTLPNFRAGKDQYSLQRSANKLAQDIRKAQQMAMSAEECAPCGDVVPVTGYGIYLDENWEGGKKYRLYADTSNIGDNAEIFDASDSVIETIEMEKGVKISSIDTIPPDTNNISINFTPPDPSVKIQYRTGGGGGGSVKSVTITTIILSLENDLSKTKTVKINSTGMIEIE